jgi:hypothetical protein
LEDGKQEAAQAEMDAMRAEVAKDEAKEESVKQATEPK